MRHLLSIEDLERADIERILERAAVVRRGLRARDQEGPRAARPHRGQPVLRGLHAHLVLVRAGGQAPVGRPGVGALDRLGGGQGRVAQGHDPDAQRLRPGGDRGAPPARRRRQRWSRAGAGRRWSTPATASTSTPRRRCSTCTRCAERLGDSLDGTRIWIVGDVLHSRVARSDILAFERMGAKVTVCGPPTLIPRDIEALGCDVAHSLDGLGEADVIYALRMQRERMTEAFVPSLREYAERYQINGRRLRPGQVLMHPGPVNRGVELAGRRDRLAAVDHHRPGPGRGDRAHGRPVRAAGRALGHDHGRADARRRARAHRGGGVNAPDPGARAAPPTCWCRGAHVLDPRAGLDGPHDVLVRAGTVAELGAPGSLVADDGRRARRRRRAPPVPRLRRPPRAPAHARPGAQGGPRHRHPRRGRGRLLRGGGDAQHRPRRWTARRCSMPLREAAGRQARVPVGFLAAISPRAGRRAADRDGRPSATPERWASPTTACRWPAPGCCAARCSTSACAAAWSPCTRRTRRCRATGSCTRARSSALLGLAGIPSVSESTWWPATPPWPRYEGARVHVAARVGGRVGGGAWPRPRPRACAITAEVCPHHLTLTDQVLAPVPETRFKMSPPLRAERDRDALVDALRSGTIDCVATDHAPHAREEKEAPFEQAPMGTTGLETAFAALHTELVLPGHAGAGHAGGADDRRRARATTSRCRRVAVGEPANLCLAGPRRRVGGRRGRLREPLGQLLLRRARAARPGGADGGRRRRGPPRSRARRGGGRERERRRLRPARGRRALRRRRLRGPRSGDRARSCSTPPCPATRSR